MNIKASIEHDEWGNLVLHCDYDALTIALEQNKGDEWYIIEQAVKQIHSRHALEQLAQWLTENTDLNASLKPIEESRYD